MSVLLFIATGYLGGIGLLFCGKWFFSSMRTALNKIYGVRVSINPLFGKLKDFGMILLVVVFFLNSYYLFTKLLYALVRQYLRENDYIGRIESQK
jgi:uncharacterized BrkB/YihY/UPF0761 family membrane protein